MFFVLKNLLLIGNNSVTLKQKPTVLFWGQLITKRGVRKIKCLQIPFFCSPSYVCILTENNSELHQRIIWALMSWCVQADLVLCDFFLCDFPLTQSGIDNPWPHLSSVGDQQKARSLTPLFVSELITLVV